MWFQLRPLVSGGSAIVHIFKPWNLIIHGNIAESVVPFSISADPRNLIGFIEIILLVSRCLVADVKSGILRATCDWTTELPFELIPSATRIIIKVKTIPISDVRKSTIMYCELLPASYAAIMEIKAAAYRAPDSMIITMTGKRVECIRVCFSSRWLRQILKAMRLVQVRVVARLIDHAKEIHGESRNSNTTLPGLVLENSQHTTTAAVVVPRTMITGRTIIYQRLFQTM